MPVKLARDVCRDFNETVSHEWVITNKRGGYASGTVAGVLTRLRHGLLVARPANETVPYVLLAKIDEEVSFDQRSYYLGTNEYRNGTLRPVGFVHLETFLEEDGTLIFTYYLGGKNDVMLEKRIWMPTGQNTTIVQYRATSASEAGSQEDMAPDDEESPENTQSAIELTLLPFATYHPYDQQLTEEEETPFCLQVYCTAAKTQPLGAPPRPRAVGCTIQANPHALPLHLLAKGSPYSQVTFIPTGVWYRHFLYRHDSTTDNLYLPGVIRASLQAGKGDTLTIAVSTEELPEYQG